MKSIDLECKVLLSKKLREVVNERTKFSLVVNKLIDGVGYGEIKVELNDDFGDFDGETCIILDFNKDAVEKYRDQTEDAEDAEDTENTVDVDDETNDESDNPEDQYIEEIDFEGGGNNYVANIFSSVDQDEDEVKEPKSRVKKTAKSKNKKRAAVGNIAVVDPDGAEKEFHKREIPKEFPQLNNQRCRSYIKNLEEFLSALNSANEKNNAKHINKSAYVVNEKYGSITINDLNISLKKNEPYDIGKISLDTLNESRDFVSLIRNKMIRFLTPEAAEDMMNNGDEDDDHGLEIFDSHEEAEREIGRFIDTDGDEDGEDDGDEDYEDDARRPSRNQKHSKQAKNSKSSKSSKKYKKPDRIDVSEDDIDKKTEEEEMIFNLTSGNKNDTNDTNDTNDDNDEPRVRKTRHRA